MSVPQLSPIGENARRARIVSTLESIATDLIGIEAAKLDPHATFLEMGADSLSLLQASQAIQARLGMKIPFRLLFEELSTIESLADHIDAHSPPERTFEVKPERVVAGSSESSRIWEPPTASQSPPRQSPPPSAAVEPATLAAVNDYQSIAEHLQSAESGESIERILALQLQLMSQQLKLLHSGHLTQPTTPISAPPQPPAEIAETAGREPKILPALNGLGQNPKRDSQPVETSAPIIDPAPFVAYEPIDKKKGASGLTPGQQRHLESLIERLSRRTAGSKRLAQQYRYRLADSSASAGFRTLWKELCYPITVERAVGSRAWDVDGNEYVDITMGFGSLLFGHSPAFIMEAIEEQLSTGLRIGWKTEIAGKAAELVAELTGAERVAFCNSGTEAVMSALRLARAVTGRVKIAVFAGSFHGTFDGVMVKGERNPDGALRAVPMAPGVPEHMIDQVLVLTHGDPKSLEILKANVHELAAVLVEPSPSRRPDLQTKDFLQQLRQLTTAGGAALIFDEVIIGFRMHPGGAQALFEVQADIVAYGKALGAGTPIGAVAGKASFLDAVDGGMWNYGDASFPRAETTYYAGTFFKHPITMSAAYAALKHMKECGPALQQQLNERTAKFVEGLNVFFRQEHLPIQAACFGSLFRFFYPKDLKYMDLFFFHLLEKGVWMAETRVCFVSTTTTDEDLAHVAKAVKESVAELQAVGFLPSRSPDPERDSLGLQALAAPSARNGGMAEERIVPATEAQKGLWALAQMGPEISSAYNESMIVRLRGPLNIAAIQKAIQQIVDRHEALRANFSEDGNFQRIAASVSVETPLTDLSDAGAEDVKQRTAVWLTSIIKRPFDLLNGPLVRAHLAKLDDQQHLLALVLHHLISDAWSFNILMGEISALYGAECQGLAGAACELPPPTPYSDYGRRQSERQFSKEDEASERYWLSRFEGRITPLELPTDRPRPQLQTYTGARQRLKIDAALCRDLKEFSAKGGHTLFMTLLSGFNVLLRRLTGQDDIVVGSHSSGQAAEMGGANLVGFCINLLPMRSRLIGNPGFDDYLRSVKRNLLDAYQHQNYPISRLIKKLKLVRDPSRPPLVNVVFNMDWAMSLDRSTSGLKAAGLEMEMVEGPVVFARFDLLWNLVDVGSGLVLDCAYNTDLFDAQTIQEWMESYKTLLSVVVSQPGIRVDELGEMLIKTDAQRQSVKRDELKREPPQKLKIVKRKAKGLWSLDSVTTELMAGEKTVPLIIRPSAPDVDIEGWIRQHREWVEAHLFKHGALLYRGFKVNSVAEFERCARAVSPELFAEYGDLPPEWPGGPIYQSTPYPSDQTILFHNEASHTPIWPLKQWFFCIQHAAQGGETPVADCRKIYESLDADIIERFKQKQLMYVRNFSAGLDVKWQDFFKTEEKSIVERQCRESGIDFEWKENDGLRTRYVCPAIVRHPRTGEMVFFNQVQLHHPYCLTSTLRESLRALFREEDMPRNVYYGDGSPIEDALMEEIGRVYWQTATSFLWQPGDILMLDNMLAAHARKPYSGPRKIVVAMAEMISRRALTC